MEGDRLVAHGPQSAEPIVEKLREHKAEVLALLAGGDHEGRRPPLPTQPAPDSIRDNWHSPLAVLIDQMRAAGLGAEQALAVALAQQAVDHAAMCGVDPWMVGEPDEHGVSVLRCWLCGFLAPPDMQVEHFAARKRTGAS
jgi:hypothetical protein